MYTVCSVCTYNSPPAQLLQELRPLPAIRYSQLTGRTRVKTEQSKERSKRLVAAIQTEELLVQQDTNTRGAVIALITQSEENIWLNAVSDEEGAWWCVHEYFVCLLHGHWPPVVTTVLKLLVGELH